MACFHGRTIDRLILLRHGIAVEPSADQPDAQRPLTNKGRRRTAKAMFHLARLLGADVRIFSSPKVRARETAQLLADQIGLSIQPLDILAGEDPEAVCHWIDHQTCGPEVVLVGHEPLLGRIVSQRCTGHADGLLLKLPKAGVVMLVRSQVDAHPMRWKLTSLLPARVLRGDAGDN